MRYLWNSNVETNVSGSQSPVDLLPILSDNGKYLEMEIYLFQTGSSYNYAVEWDICEIPTLKPMVSRSSNLMDILLIMTDNGKYP